MDQEVKKKPKSLVIIIAALAVGLLVAIFFIFERNTQIERNEEETALLKEQLEDEYENLDIQYEGFRFSLKNDSLLKQIENEQAKVQRLREELRQTKAEDKATIKKLQDELASLRKVLRSYIVQIDSLNRLNEKLTKEKEEITNKYNETHRALNEVSQQKEDLNEKVSLAAKLDATNINVTAVNKKGKAQKKISKAQQLVVNFLITKNITAEPGDRTIYVRIMKPDDDVLTKSRANTFTYENASVNYSMKRIIEYAGEEMGVTLYWDIEEYLMPGTYRVDIFADGNRIGSKSFTLND